jgi:guanylate kinase
MKQKKLVILCGPSSVGKDSIQTMLGMNPIVSHTTRPMREGEIDGETYHFVSKDGFDKTSMIETRKYHTLLNGKPDTWYYGVSVGEIIEKVNGCNTPIVILDIKGMLEMRLWCKQNGIESIAFYIKTSPFVRTIRAIKRGSFSWKEWFRRLKADKYDFFDAEVMCDYTIKNKNLSNAVDEILKIVFGGADEKG